MVRSIRHKGLKRLYQEDDPRGVIAEHAGRLRDTLAHLDASSSPEDMDLPGFRLHPLKGGLRGSWGCYCSRQLAGNFSFCGSTCGRR
ncbi:MAG: type II toxin-antitoxin system RelE/ParE family toxin [Acidobacteriaceae bacterium]